MPEHIQSPIFESKLDNWDSANEDFADWDDDLNFSPTPVTPRRRNSDPVIPSSGPLRSSPIFESKLDNWDSANEDFADWDDDLNFSPTPVTPRRRNSDPVIPSSGPLRSSPIVGTIQERRVHRLRKAKRSREEKQTAKRRDAEGRREEVLENVLSKVLLLLESEQLKLWDLLEFVFNPEYKQGKIRYGQFFAKKGHSTAILDWWLSPQNTAQEAKDEIHDWIASYATRIVSSEARAVTESRVLQTMKKTIDFRVVKDFDIDQLHSTLKQQSYAPFTMKVLEAFTTSRKAKLHSENRRHKTKLVVTSAALSCLGQYSHANNLSKRMMGLYLYASGAQRQCITILSTLGVCESYTNLMSKKIRRVRKTKKPPIPQPPAIDSDDNPFVDTPRLDVEESIVPPQPPQRTGTIYQLSDSMRSEARALASTGLYGEVFDNVNIGFGNTEQIIGRHDSQENGTASTIFPLFDAKLEDIDLKSFQASYLNASPLKLDDILLNHNERTQFKSNLIHTILRIIVKHGGKGFSKFDDAIKKCEPVTPQKIPVHKTELNPLPSWPIDESSIIGNAEFDEALTKELLLDEEHVPTVSDRVRFVGGDQLSIARLRALEFIRAGQEEKYEGFFWGAWMPGLFHAKIADAHGTLLNHLGKPDSGSRNPGSLAFHNTRLDRLPITATSLPTFRTCRDLIFVSLYARVLHCLLLVSGYRSLNEYLLKVTSYEQLVEHATKIYTQFANAQLVEELRSARNETMEDAEEGAKPTAGDAVFENASLFMRDALITREFNDAIKCGDSGRVVLILKTWALSFRGNGRTKYAYEMLHLIHNLTTVWPAPVRDIVMKNWLLNPSGKPNRFVEMDLVQEHLNFKIKVLYKARGSNASWDWLETISPCVVALSELQKLFNLDLGGDQGIEHAEADLSADIKSLMDSLDEHQVYRIIRGRMLMDDEIVKDVILIGLQNMTAGDKNPIGDYNLTFLKLQKRRGMKPVTELTPENSTALSPNPSTSSPQTSQLHPSSQPPITPVDEPNTAEEFEDPEVGGKSELEQIIEDLNNGILEEPTLSRVSEDDVAYDMDEVVIEESVDAVVESDSESESEYEG